MLQIPILVLFTIFYVSSPGWSPLMGLGTQDPVANVPSSEGEVGSDASSLG